MDRNLARVLDVDVLRGMRIAGVGKDARLELGAVRGLVVLDDANPGVIVSSSSSANLASCLISSTHSFASAIDGASR